METESLADAIAMATNALVKYSIPLYSEDLNGKPLLRGTGFVVSANGHAFLVSAAHVFDIAIVETLFFFTGPKRVQLVKGQLARSSASSGRDQDPADVGVLRLPKSASPPYPTVDKFAMPISHLRARHLPRSGKEYVFIGFPASKSDAHATRKEAEVAPFAFLLRSIEDDAYAANGIDVGRHIGLKLDRRRGHTLDGRKAHFPRPNGMSGSPIIALYDDQGDNDEPVFPVVGVATRYDESRQLVRGADIADVIDAIAQMS